MLSIAGQPAGQIGLKFFVDTHGKGRKKYWSRNTDGVT